MEQQTTKHLMYCPWTGLGLYNGFRGNKWLKNRIKIFKQFVIPSLLAQTSHEFTLWCSWRPEEKNNPLVKEFINYLSTIKEFNSVHTFSGVCFYDDKYDDKTARERLINSLHGAIPYLINEVGGYKYVLMTIQPSDDLYVNYLISGVKRTFEELPQVKAIGFAKGYVCNYLTKQVAEYNPTTNPPFVTIKFPKEIFIDPLKHAEYTAMKRDEAQYKKGTPCPSHEYYPNVFGPEYLIVKARGFMVGTHGANISTTWQIPFKGEIVSSEVLKEFGVYDAPPLKIKLSLRRRLYLSLPYRAQRKLRYWITEKFKKK